MLFSSDLQVETRYVHHVSGDDEYRLHPVKSLFLSPAMKNKCPLQANSPDSAREDRAANVSDPPGTTQKATYSSLLF